MGVFYSLLDRLWLLNWAGADFAIGALSLVGQRTPSPLSAFALKVGFAAPTSTNARARLCSLGSALRAQPSPSPHSFPTVASTCASGAGEARKTPV